LAKEIDQGRSLDERSVNDGHQLGHQRSKTCNVGVARSGYIEAQ